MTTSFGCGVPPVVEYEYSIFSTSLKLHTHRLKIVGLLAQEPRTVEQMAALLNLQPSTVSHHLSRLGDAGLVSAQAQGYYNVYRLEAGALEEMARRLLAQETLPAIVADVDTDAYDRKVLRDFSTPDGRLKQLPLQRRKFEAILRHVVKPFEYGVRYSEKHVNEILSQYHEDTAALRRGLVDTGLMSRDHGVYWREERNVKRETQSVGCDESRVGAERETLSGDC